MPRKQIILGVRIGNFTKQAVDVQKVFSEYGCSIRTRIGLHDVNDGICSPQGIILVEFIGGAKKANTMVEQLAAIKGVTVQQMTL